MCEVILNKNGKYEFVSNNEWMNDVPSFQWDNVKYMHPTLYFARETAKTLLGYDKSILLCRNITMTSSWSRYMICNSDEMIAFDTRDVDVWYKFIKILVSSPKKININTSIMVISGVITEYNCTMEVISKPNGCKYLAKTHKIYTYPYQIDTPDGTVDDNHNTINMISRDTIYKMTKEYKAIKAKALRYFTNCLQYVCINECLSDIKLIFF
jgi:hypothetical protein